MERATTGSCHCGAVRLGVTHAPLEVTECHCSICRRLGALWAYYSADEVTLTGTTEVYARGPRRIGFHRCGTCGCVVGWWAFNEGYGQCAVNARLLDGFDLTTVTHIVEEDASV